MTPPIPVFDFHTPWVALIQVALVFALPTLTGYVTDKFTASLLKVVILGGTTFATSFLTGLLDSIVSGFTYDWVNALANGVITWLLAVGAYQGILKPAGVTNKAQESNVIQLFGPSKAAVAAGLVDDQKAA